MRRPKTSTLVLILFSLVRSIVASETPHANTADQLPSISELDKLIFTPADPGSVSSIPYPETSTLRGLFLAYNAGSEAVSRYRDPVLTRGASGVTVFKTVAPAVVVVVVGSVKDDKFNPDGLGTGAIVDRRGYVLTNWHVIQGHSDALIFLKPPAGAELAHADARVGRVIYQNSTADLALLKMIDAPAAALPSIPIADMTDIQIAEDIHIIGHPKGNFWSYSTGVVSQIRNDYQWSYEDGSKHEAKVLQLQTAISPGNSGGPVVNDSGKILGLVAMSEEGQNLDYAIAADVIQHFLFTGMQMTTRGMPKIKIDHPAPQQLYVSKIGDSTQVAKAVYWDAVLYAIDGKNAGLVARFSDGTVVKAWGKTPEGDFEAWSATLPNGKEFVATASRGSLAGISAKQ